MQFCEASMETWNQKEDALFTFSLSQYDSSSFSVQPVFLYYFNSQCSWLLNLPQNPNQELVLTNGMVNQTVEHAGDAVQTLQVGVNDSPKMVGSLSKNTSLEAGPHEAQKNKNMGKITKIQKNHREELEFESYVPQEEFQNENAYSNVCQSKNIPKNYGKAIVNFIKRNESFVRRVLIHLKLNFRDFMRSVSQIKRKLKTISQLRALWLEKQNVFAKAYRTISLEYLRKHSLSYIFNSRVANFHKHIKYRYKMIESVGDPINFTIMKEF